MANNLTGNPKSFDTTGTITGQWIQQIQWVDDNADLAASADLSYTMNGVTVLVKPTAAAVAGIGYQAGPFAKPIFADTFVINVIDFGTVLVWVV